MPFLGSQIVDTFTVRDNNMQPITGSTFSAISIWVNGVTSNQAVTFVESSISAGYYKLTFTPSASGSWYIRFSGSPSGQFDANYFVEQPDSMTATISNAVWTNPLTGYAFSDIAHDVWRFSSNYPLSPYTMGAALTTSRQVLIGKWVMTANQLHLYDQDEVHILKTFDLYNLADQLSMTGVVKRLPNPPYEPPS